MRGILDNDLYKFTMQQAVLELFPKAEATYTFINRGKHKFNELFMRTLQFKISSLSQYYLTLKEANWFVLKCPYLKPQYIQYLLNYTFNPNEVHAYLDANNELQLSISGPWHTTILWEVPLLALISETYFETVDYNWYFDSELYTSVFRTKMQKLAECRVTDFGTRRRRSFETQKLVVSEGINFKNFAGTSNVYLAYAFATRPVGTMAHEWIMANSVLEGLRNANYYALQNWVRVYNADLGTALTDTYGLDAFLKNFNMRLAKLYDGVRHDSGDPYIFIDKVILHYKSLGIDPMTKSALFSDALTPETAVQINEYCKGKIRCSFGIGTNFTNDFSYCNSKALNMVIKLNTLNGIPVIKLSENVQKACGDKDAIRVAKWTFYNTPLDSK